jgi:hypothetical protein
LSGDFTINAQARDDNVAYETGFAVGLEVGLGVATAMPADVAISSRKASKSLIASV